ncbi:MAG: hypothetical protein A3I21_00480 [Candidatus Zambryskibacteria bacterium RIFCSPLOWO2_02_FULL_39_69]|uniref:DUF5667 domain-containing protein n=2 Tax=Candidatus Zambryskiibacteriota TaxID=1817925 RepID=A0A1G2T5W2_9BACT|nr:MAG: hypothetical protein A2W58_01515 [Candidatus Zambryskibacteria bacterium RIFCSPHIGHO2_02_38_10.5]OHA97113.1 MAG: hypothetical protein A3C63_01525 [Candidatus Zambryskibacteria bacterium RIFCSPHIGHO2_02_FULL_39_82]OHB08581.1 MAG: hypothetical protein A2W64_01240 [Candidatus Zambryskibacteria bacterium RIFCSPLOWO2_02_39_10]OHB10006.1 MAG: hypothetical protein A3I21_00480 [Candidatus Zambryskibacteria bacterium RIFCSPLOWO2_02_FULL_39_69]OHB12622.1 MAG: hypothetical protein A2Y49_01205 [Can
MRKLLLATNLALSAFLAILLYENAPKPVTEITIAEASGESVRDLQKEYKELKAESESVLLKAQIRPSQRPCFAYEQYLEMTYLREQYIQVKGLSVPDDLPMVLENLAISAAEQVYEKIKKEELLNCGGNDSNIVEMSARIMDEYRKGFIREDVIREAYLREVRREIKAVLNAFKEDRTEDTREYAMLLIGHTENVWQFTLLELGVSRAVYKELFLE